MYAAKFNPNRLFGVEIEAYNLLDRQSLIHELRHQEITCEPVRYSHNTSGAWKIMNDSSISGLGSFELVSPPLKGEEGLQQLRIVMEVLQGVGAKVNKSCGFHVHWDCRDATGSHLKNILGFYAKFEPVIDLLVPPSRRTNTYCGTTRRNGGLDWINSLNSPTARGVACQFSGGDNPRNSTRYCKVNLNSYLTYGTVEFRQFQGTLNFQKAFAWIVFTQCIVERGIGLGLKLQEPKKLTLGELFRVLKACPHHTEDLTVLEMRRIIFQMHKKFSTPPT